VEAAEVDEMWSFVGSKRQQRWLWHAIDHHTGQVLAYVFGTREDETFLRLKELLAPFGITHFYTDGWGAYRRHIDPDKHTVGKQHTQKIERKHTTLRARIKRLVRKTICFSKSIQMHDLVIGLFINRFAYGRAIWISDQLIWNITEFFMDWLMRKVMVQPPEYTLWPPALRLFYRFLSEKGYLDHNLEPILQGL
jgi:insertion element IS1 protein InsB